MHDVFISYSSKDMTQAETVRNVLEQNGIPCWMAPRDIPGGSNYTKEIPSAIRGCQVFVLILSQNAQNSHWVLKELDSAVNNGKVILPFMLEDCELNDEFNFLLTGAQRYSAYQKKAEALETLISRIRAITNTKSEGGAAAEAKTTVDTEAVAEEPQPAPQKTASKEVDYLGTLRCPACDGVNLVELTNKTGRFDFAEKLSLLLIPIVSLTIGFAAMFLVTFIGVALTAYSDLITNLMIIALFVGLVIGGFLGNRISKEWIRRRRVRKHIYAHPLRCKDCKKEFLPNKNEGVIL